MNNMCHNFAQIVAYINHVSKGKVKGKVAPVL
jgi:hypothetical protein